MATLSLPLALSYDPRGVAAYATMQAAKDQRRVNCHYEITRSSVDSRPEVALAKRPGVTGDGNTYGAGTQVQYLVSRDPASTWNPTPWVLVKDGTNSKAVTSSTSTTILNDTNFYPRFVDIVDVNATNTMVVQLQNSATPTGAGNQKVYTSSAIATFTQISDADFTGLDQRGKMEFLDGYGFIMDNRNRIYHSDLNSLSAWTSTNYISKSVLSDPPQGLIRYKNHLLAFGVNTVESFYNAGNATGSVLSRVTNSQQRIGLAAVAGGGSSMTGKTNYYCSFGDITFFLGRYEGSQNDTSLIAFDGSSFRKVSRPYEDTLLSTATVYGIFPVSFGGKVAVAIQMTLPTATTQKWLMFFPDINEMFEWESTVFGPANNGYHFAGATDPQKLYYFGTSDVFQDAGGDFTMTAQFRLPNEDHRYKSMVSCGVIADTTGSASNLGVAFSDDDCATFSTARNIDLSKQMKTIRRCGMFRERFVKLTSTDSNEVRLRRFYASVL